MPLTDRKAVQAYARTKGGVLQGIFIDGRRPKSKKEVREVAKSAPSRIEVEATSAFGNEFGGNLTELPVFASVTFVGPDPYQKRDFYGTVSNTDGPKGFVVK